MRLLRSLDSDYEPAHPLYEQVMSPEMSTDAE